MLDGEGTGAPVEMSDSAMDAAIGGESTSRDIPMSAPVASTATPQEYTIKVGGKDIKAPLDKVLQWAQMGYQYPQKAGELNQKQAEFQRQQQEFEARSKEYETKYAPYKSVDEYATQNPEWWNHVQQTYQQKMAGAETNSDVMRIKQELMQELAPFKEFIQSQQAKEKSQKIEQEDKQLSGEIESIRKSYSNIDFDSPDEAGLSLEMKVLKHAQEQNIPTFRAAFRDYYHDHLIGKAQETGKELLSKDIQKRTKLGILGETSKPTKGLKTAENVKNKSYSELMREGLEELGIA